MSLSLAISAMRSFVALESHVPLTRREYNSVLEDRVQRPEGHMKRVALLIAMFLALAIAPVTKADGVRVTDHSHDAIPQAIIASTTHLNSWCMDDFSFRGGSSSFGLFSAKGPVTDRVGYLLRHNDIDSPGTPMATTPEPSGLILLVVGLGFVFLMRRRMVTQP